eukprot:GSMAST32.ASY1.ANO1.326.1 assembled CDS
MNYFSVRKQKQVQYNIMTDSNMAVAATVVAGLFVAHQGWSWFRYHQRKKRYSSYKRLKLLPNEVGPMICKAPATSTITYFSGSLSEATKYFSARTKEILIANPWLCGILDRDENGELTIFIPPSSGPLIEQGYWFTVRTVDLSSNYHSMVKSLSPFLCGTSEETEGTNKPLWRVTLIPNGRNKFALIVSANHSLLDGHGYYRIFNMLSSEAKVEALSPDRNQKIPSKIKEAMGGELSFMSPPPGFLFRFIFGVLKNMFFPSTDSFGFYISKTWLDEQKSKHKSKNNDNRNVAFISTNDILVSTFCNVLQCDVAIMAINFRGKIENLDDDQIGNYEDLIAYRKEDYLLPSLIRKSVTGPIYKRDSSSSMPTNWEHITKGTYGAITNWSKFAKVVKLPNGSPNPTTQDFHIPLFDFPKSTPACIVSSMVIFKPNDDQLAALVAGPTSLINDIKSCGMVASELQYFKP